MKNVVDKARRQQIYKQKTKVVNTKNSLSIKANRRLKYRMDIHEEACKVLHVNRLPIKYSDIVRSCNTAKLYMIEKETGSVLFSKFIEPGIEYDYYEYLYTYDKEVIFKVSGENLDREVIVNWTLEYRINEDVRIEGFPSRHYLLMKECKNEEQTIDKVKYY